MAIKIPTQQEKDAYNLLSQGKGLVSPLTSGSANITSELGNVAGHVTDVTGHLTNGTPAVQAALAGAGLTAGLMTSLSQSSTAGAKSVSTLVDYGHKATAEFSQRMRVADSYKSITERFTGVDTGCSAHSGVFGVVQDIGQQAMDTYHSAMNAISSAMTTLNNAIQQGLATIQQIASDVVAKINAGIAAATAFANKIIKAIEDEAKELAKQLAASTHAWLASALPDWFGDSCKGSLTNHVATPELKAAVGA